jgi:hypothetical protein
MVRLARFFAVFGAISLALISLVVDEVAANSGILKNNSKVSAVMAGALSVRQVPKSESKRSDSYDVLLHSQSLAEQRSALTVILHDPQQYVSRIQESLSDYPRLLRTDPRAASRAVYLSALVQDPSFPHILIKSLGVPDVLDECIYACPIVFALTIHACFAGWKLPENLDSELTTVSDLKSAIQYVAHITLKVGSMEDVIQGPGIEKQLKEVEGKSEEQLIGMAGPMTPSNETRSFAALRLETLVSGSKNRVELYLLALNDFEDGSGEYKSAVYQAIYRAELAKARGQ